MFFYPEFTEGRTHMKILSAPQGISLLAAQVYSIFYPLSSADICAYTGVIHTAPPPFGRLRRAG